MTWANQHHLLPLLLLLLLMGSCVLVGTWLVLREMTMLANAISHTVLLGIVVAYWLEGILPQGRNLLWGFGLRLPLACLVAAVTMYTSKRMQQLGIQQDASIALSFSTFFALGVAALSVLFPHSHVGLEVMMGNFEGAVWEDLPPLLLLLLFNLLVGVLAHRAYTLSTFDPLLAQVYGVSSSWLDLILLVQVTLTVMVGFKIVGVFLVLALLVGPALCGRLLAQGLVELMVLSAVIGGLGALLSTWLSQVIFDHMGVALSTAGLFTTLLLLFFMVLLRTGRRLPL